MSLFRKTPKTVEPVAPAYSFCEHVGATDTSPIHLRSVGEEGQKFGGGVPGAALCGRDLRKGWDLPQAVTPDSVRFDITPRPGDGRVFGCLACAEIYLAQSAPATPAG